LETPKANILRVKNRVLNGGHDIPTIYDDEKYQEFLKDLNANDR